MAPPLDVDCLLSTFEYLIQLDVQQGILQHDDVIHRRYLHALNEAIGIAALTSGDRGSSAGNMLEPRDNAISLEQTYIPALMTYPDSVGNTGEQINSDWIDPSLIDVPSVTFGQNDFNSILARSPRGQAFHSPRPVSHGAESQSIVSGNAASPPPDCLEEVHNDLDSFSGFSIGTHTAQPSLPDLHRDNNMVHSEILAELDQNFFSLDEYMDNGSLTALLEAENELSVATAPWKTKHDGSKVLNTMETNFNYDE